MQRVRTWDWIESRLRTLGCSEEQIARHMMALKSQCRRAPPRKAQGAFSGLTAAPATNAEKRTGRQCRGSERLSRGLGERRCDDLA